MAEAEPKSRTEVTLTLRVPGILSDEERSVLKQIITAATLDFSDSRNVMVMKLPREAGEDGKPAPHALAQEERIVLATTIMEIIKGYYATRRVLVKVLPKSWDEQDCVNFFNALEALYKQAGEG